MPLGLGRCPLHDRGSTGSKGCSPSSGLSCLMAALGLQQAAVLLGGSVSCFMGCGVVALDGVRRSGDKVDTQQVTIAMVKEF